MHNLRRSGTAEEFLRKDFLYQLTSEGAEVHRTLTAIDRQMGSAGALQASMLPEVLEALNLLLASTGHTPPDLAGANRAFQRLVSGFTQLSENAKRFVQGLNRSLAAEGKLDIEAFLAYEDCLHRRPWRRETPGREPPSLTGAMFLTNIGRGCRCKKPLLYRSW
ncbi:DUF2397 family protein [Streptomyces cellulosae]